MRAAMLSAAILVVGCGDSTPTIDARKTIDAKAIDARPIDAALVVDASRITCFTNYDCPASEKCFAEVGTTDARCVTGARGTGLVGTTCITENQCKSALCVEAATGQGMKCSDTCTGPQDCAPSLPRCVFVFSEKICVR